MADRLLYRELLTYDDVERADIGDIVRSQGIDDERAVAAIINAFMSAKQKSLRQLEDVIGNLRDEALDAPVTIETAKSVLNLNLPPI